MPEVTLFFCEADTRVDRPLSRALRDRAAALFCPGQSVSFSEERTGRPTVTHPAGLEVSVSHSDRCFLAAFSRGVRLGVDLEHVREGERLARVLARVLSQEEWRALCATPQADFAREATRVWTELEAAAKLSGRGLAALLARTPRTDVHLTDVGASLGTAGLCATLATERACTVRLEYLEGPWSKNAL